MSLICQLGHFLNKNEDEVTRFLRNAPKKYKVYKIPKRSHGHRVIAQPSKELKQYQRAFLELYNFPVHDAAKAYKKGISIKENALVHKSNQYLLKTDLENFFNSITPNLFWKCLDECSSKKPFFTTEDREWVEKLIFWCPSRKTGGKHVLSVGAPSSPHISNFCLLGFDHFFSDHCYKLDISYSRYADDLTFSTNIKGQLQPILPSLIAALLNYFGTELRINHSKTVLSSKAHNRHVTGVTLNNYGQLSIGRERKRYIKHLVHQFKFNKLDCSAINHLHGLLSFARHIEPVFIERLKLKYSEQLIERIYEACNDQ
ncbi:Retron-type RNA-directed DNA polymerase [hydrothermal vent metagenome]|uniref:Retron-type RNA-directed DNA polymerase n=1 Tax=hydrothermal vent metagenome TaxID=652676 RepID=A0A3B0W0Z4_9ZZZZ